MRKKCLAGIMVLCLLLSMMPTMAFATEAECTKTEGCTAVAHEEGCPAADPAGGGDGNDHGAAGRTSRRLYRVDKYRFPADERHLPPGYKCDGDRKNHCGRMGQFSPRDSS